MRIPTLRYLREQKLERIKEEIEHQKRKLVLYTNQSECRWFSVKLPGLREEIIRLNKEKAKLEKKLEKGLTNNSQCDIIKMK